MTGRDTPTAYILAGGFGTRLRPVLADRPKALAEILGRPCIHHQLDALARSGLSRVVLCTGYRADQLEAAVGPDYRGMAIAVSREETPLGTGGALRLALSRFPAELALVLNGDSLTDADPAAFLGWFAAREALGALALVPVEDTARYGSVATAPDGRITGFVEKGRQGPGMVSAGMYLLRPGCLDGIEPGQAASIEHDVFPPLAARGALWAWETRARLLDIGTPESYAGAARFLLGPKPSGPGAGSAVIVDRDLLVSGAGLAADAAEALGRLAGLGLRLVVAGRGPGCNREGARAAQEREQGRVTALLAAAGVGPDAMYGWEPRTQDSGAAAARALADLTVRVRGDLALSGPVWLVSGRGPCGIEPGLVANPATVAVATATDAGRDAVGPEQPVEGLSAAAHCVAQQLAAREAKAREPR